MNPVPNSLYVVRMNKTHHRFAHQHLRFVCIQKHCRGLIRKDYNAILVDYNAVRGGFYKKTITIFALL